MEPTSESVAILERPAFQSTEHILQRPPELIRQQNIALERFGNKGILEVVRAPETNEISHVVINDFRAFQEGRTKDLIASAIAGRQCGY